MNLLLFVAQGGLEDWISQLSILAVLVASVLLVVLVLLAIWANKRKKKQFKAPLFIAILIVVVGTTLTISGSTIYLNIASAAGGPVHWHADFEIWACGNELDLRDPIGALSNKIGTPSLHEHNDKRIHLEGVPVSLPQDASLGKFMNVVGGELTKDKLVVPLNDSKYFQNGPGQEDGDGPSASAPNLITPFISTTKDGKQASFTTGQKCGDQAAQVQVFVYKFNAKDNTYKQTKLSDPASYGISHESDVPPGDCVIFEFAPPEGHTNKLCKQYGIRDKVKCERFGISDTDRKVCVNTELR